MSLRHNEKWERNFALLEQFHKEFGRFPMQKDIYHDVKLGLWCANQRRDVANGKCMPEREVRLRELGLIRNNTFDVHWENCFALLQKFVAAYGRFPTDTECFEGFNLGKWCSNQKMHAKLPDYPQERIEKLTQIGLLHNTRGAVWEEHYRSLQRFVEMYGRMPTRKDVFEGFHLGSWCSEQRRKIKAGQYDAQRAAKLIDLGLMADKPGMRSWDESFALLQAYVQEYGKFPVSGEKYSGYSLGSWSEMQKFLARNTEYPPERKQMLADLGLFHNTQDARWERQYQLLEAFVAEYGRLPKQKELYHGEQLGVWCAMQKQRCKKESYPASRKEKLRDIGLIQGNSLSFF